VDAPIDVTVAVDDPGFGARRFWDPVTPVACEKPERWRGAPMLPSVPSEHHLGPSFTSDCSILSARPPQPHADNANVQAPSQPWDPSLQEGQHSRARVSSESEPALPWAGLVLKDGAEHTATAPPPLVSPSVASNSTTTALTSGNVGVASKVSGMGAQPTAKSGVLEEVPLDIREIARCRARTVCSIVVLLTFGTMFGLAAIIYKLGLDYNDPQCSEEAVQDAKTCEPCGDGTLFLPIGGEWEKSLDENIRAVLYLAFLAWCFLGVTLVCDQFMNAIEEITSMERVVCIHPANGGEPQIYHVHVWNATVANLTLMALGSSAPEILLSCVELMVMNEMFAGDLGPSTIVGSAAFNLLVITGLCISAVPDHDKRRIQGIEVFITTALVSVLAYFWLIVILRMETKDLVDPWEALVTFIFFPFLVLAAFLVDKGWLPGGSSRQNSSRSPERNSQDSDSMPNLAKDIGRLGDCGFTRSESKESRVSKAFHRASITRSITGISQKSREDGFMEVTYGFQRRRYTVTKSGSSVILSVVRSRPSFPVVRSPKQQEAFEVRVRYCTQDGQAKAGVDYEQTEGTLSFGPTDYEKSVEIPLLNGKCSGETVDGDFDVCLGDVEVFWTQAQALASDAPDQVSPRRSMDEVHVLYGLRSSHSIATVIVHNCAAGQLSFVNPEVSAKEDDEHLTLRVKRTEGSFGAISCHYETIEGSAMEGVDFQRAEGLLNFANGEDMQSISVSIRRKPHPEDRRFRVSLSNASAGVTLHHDGGGDGTSCEAVAILKGSRAKGCNSYTVRRIYSCVNHRKCVVGMRKWREQFPAAVYCRGSVEDQSEASIQDWFCHVLTLFWKVMFAFVPPPEIGGGWPCFILALCGIGILTALVGDTASLLGCAVGMPDDVTAITFVALGTSLPDTFASMSAALHDDSADNAIGNVTGSNSVNVFLGLGLPWTVGAFYWSYHGKTQAWRKHLYRGETYDSRWGPIYSEGGFIVPAGNLVFSVTVFTIAAILCITLLMWRRRTCGAELGGSWFQQRRDTGILLVLWVLYLVASITNSLNEDASK